VTERDIVERLHGLCLLADRLRAPSHRHTPEDYVAERDELRDHARRFYRDLTGSWPGHEAGASGQERRPRPPVPAAVLRHRERVRSAAR
jgi:outer membrane protein TolC